MPTEQNGNSDAYLPTHPPPSPRPAPTDALSALHFSALYDDTSGEIRVMQPKIQAAASLQPHFIPGGTFEVMSKCLKFAKIEVWKDSSDLDSAPFLWDTVFSPWSTI